MVLCCWQLSPVARMCTNGCCVWLVVCMMEVLVVQSGIRFTQGRWTRDLVVRVGCGCVNFGGGGI